MTIDQKHQTTTKKARISLLKHINRPFENMFYANACQVIPHAKKMNES